MCGRLTQIGYLIPGFRVSFPVWGGFDFRCFRFFVFSRSVLFRSLSASFGLLLLSWPERLRDCLGLSWGSVWGGFRSTRKPGIKLPRALNISWTFSLLADQNKSRKLASGVPFGERRKLELPHANEVSKVVAFPSGPTCDLIRKTLGEVGEGPPLALLGSILGWSWGFLVLF